MRQKPWPYLFLVSLFSLSFLSATAYADDLTADPTVPGGRNQPVVAPIPAGTDSANPVVAPFPSGTDPANPVVAPVPSGTDPSNPGVSSASPSNDVSFPAPTPISTNTAPGNNP